MKNQPYGQLIWFGVWPARTNLLIAYHSSLVKVQRPFPIGLQRSRPLWHSHIGGVKLDCLGLLAPEGARTVSRRSAVT